MEQKGKSIENLTFNELYDVFKDGIKQAVELEFNGKRRELSPAVFLGVKYSALENAAENFDEIKEQVDNQKKKNVDPSRAMNTVLIELGRFNVDHGSRAMNEASRDIGVKLIKKHIEILSKKDYSAVMFYALVSETWISERDKDVDLEKELEEHWKNNSTLENFKGVKEAVTISFENRTGDNTLIQYDIIRGKNYQEITNPKEMNLNSTQSKGRYSGLLNHDNIPNLN